MSSLDRFDPQRLQLPGHDLKAWFPPPARPKTPRHKQGELFLKGPIPWTWLQVAARLPGRALAVALVIWHLLGLRKSNTVRLAPSKARSLGLSPRVVRRGLAALEGAGLVAVDRHRGRGPDVTVLDGPV
jgi:hypothetical protein